MCEKEKLMEEVVTELYHYLAHRNKPDIADHWAYLHLEDVPQADEYDTGEIAFVIERVGSIDDRIEVWVNDKGEMESSHTYQIQWKTDEGLVSNWMFNEKNVVSAVCGVLTQMINSIPQREDLLQTS